MCRSKHVEPSINFGIINSITKLQLVGISTELYRNVSVLNVHHFAFTTETVLENVNVSLCCNKLCRQRGEKECWATILPLTFRTTRTA